MLTINLSDTDVIRKTIEVLKSGGLVVFPSDTVYGLLVDATNPQAVQKLIQFKNRPPGKAISTFVGSIEMMKEYVSLNESEERLLRTLLPGPYTVILPSKHKVIKDLEAENGSLGVRIPKFQIVNDLVKEYGGPVTATSANLGGTSPHYSIESLLNGISLKKKELIDLIVDGGTLHKNLPSTVMDLTTSTVKVIRSGDVIGVNEKVFITESAEETAKVAQIVHETVKDETSKPLVYILQGDLGAGKTVFVKSVGNMLGVENIISPTYVIYYEYEANNKSYNKVCHFDLYQIKNSEEFNYLDIPGKLTEKSILFFEWGEKSADIMPLFTDKAKVVYITINYLGETKREIKVNF